MTEIINGYMYRIRVFSSGIAIFKYHKLPSGDWDNNSELIAYPLHSIDEVNMMLQREN